MNRFLHLLCRFGFAVLISSAIALGETPSFCGRVGMIEGSGTDSEGNLLSLGQNLSKGTQITTDEDSKVKLFLKDESIIDIGPSSKFVLTSCETRKGVQEINLELEFGLIRANVVKKFNSSKRVFKVKTPTSILGIRGTEFFIDWQKDEADNVSEQISVSEGQIEVTSLFDSVNPTFKLEAGTEFKADGLLTFEGKEKKVEIVTPPKIDQFNSSQQKEIENRVKVESKVFESAVDFSAENKKGSQPSEKSEKIVTAAEKTTDRIQTREPQSVEPSAADLSHLIVPGAEGGQGTNSGILSSQLNSGNLPFYSKITVGLK